MAEDILSKIYQKQYLPGRKLPSERKLAVDYDVSRNTIRKAIKRLVDIDVISSVPSKGNIVKKMKRSSSLIYSSVTERKENQIESKVISLIKRPMTTQEKKIFGAALAGEVWDLKRLRIMDYKVMEHQESIFPRKLFPYFDEKMGKGSIQRLIIESGFQISHSLSTFEAVNLSEDQAKIFHVKKGLAAMRVISRTITNDGTVVEFTDRLSVDYKGTFKLPFNKETFQYRHQENNPII